MEHIRLMTNLSEHPKWLDTSHVGRSVLIALWCYCGRNETDGHVPDGAARREGLTSKVAGHLTDLGWIHRNGTGWYVHDWEDHQVSVETMEARRRQLATLRQQKHRLHKLSGASRDGAVNDA